MNDLTKDASEGKGDFRAVGTASGKKYFWENYSAGGKDNNGHDIESVHAKQAEYVIYFCKTDISRSKNGKPKVFNVSDLYYECTDELLKSTATPNSLLAVINKLIPDDETDRREILEFVADAFEMGFLGQNKEGEEILRRIAAQLVGKREMKGKLTYQIASCYLGILIWCTYLFYEWKVGSPAVWALAAALGATGGFFSVCLNLNSIKVDVDQSNKFLIQAGITRSIISLIAGVACFLAIQGKVILGLIKTGTGDDAFITVATPAMLFFFFLAGFSESFIPNVLRDAESNSKKESSSRGNTKTPEATEPVDLLKPK